MVLVWIVEERYDDEDTTLLYNAKNISPKNPLYDSFVSFRPKRLSLNLFLYFSDYEESKGIFVSMQEDLVKNDENFKKVHEFRYKIKMYHLILPSKSLSLSLCRMMRCPNFFSLFIIQGQFTKDLNILQQKIEKEKTFPFFLIFRLD